MKYIENTAEYTFVCKQMYNFFYLYPNEEYKLKVISREYEPQHRTVRYYRNFFGKKHEHFLFPTTIFNTYSITRIKNPHYTPIPGSTLNPIYQESNFHQFLLRNNEGFSCLYTRSILNDGIVCLGARTYNDFVNAGPPLPMDEFVKEFWITKFDSIRSIGLLSFERAIDLRVITQLSFPFGDFMPTDSYATDEFIKI